MNHVQYAAIRRRFFPDDPTRFLIEMGYQGKRNTLEQRARRFESGKLPIPRNVARFAWLLDQWRLQGGTISEERGGTSELDDLPDWPEGI